MNISQLANEEEIGDYVIQLSMEEYYQTELFKSKKRFSRSTNELTKILAAINQGDVITIQKMLHITTAFHELDSGGWLPLHWAAVQPKPQVLRTVLWACYGMTLEAKTSEGETPLTLAAQAGLVENVKLLLERGASPHSTNDKNESPLLLAVRIGSYEMVAHLIVNGALVDQICLRKWTAMHEAAKVGCRDILMLLLRNGASTSKEDQNGITPLSIAAEHAQLDVLETLIVCGGDVNARANNGQSALMYAAGSGDPDCVTLLLHSGASPNAHNQTGHLPIHEAAYGGHYLVLKILIPVTSRRAIQVSGQSPVHSAAEGGHSHCLELLMENGFSVNTLLSDHISENYKDARKSPLFFAVSNGDVTCTEMLLNAGAKTNLDPLQCLLVAVRAGRYEIVKMLLARKADVNCYFTVVTNTVFPTALHYCIEDEVMMRLLLNNGYDVEKCFYCTHEDRSHTNHLSILLSSLGEKMLFCDYMGLEWMLKISGRVVRILLDYVNHVPICSKLKRILEKQREWPEICSILGNPRSLQHLCRLVIRKQMTPKRLCDPDIMNSAPIAPRIKRYLVYDEYDLYGSLGL